MNRPNGSLSAMPIYLTETIIKAAENGADEIVDRVSGMTKREMFAMAAVQGLFASNYAATIAQVAEDAVSAADALLAELERTK